MSSGDVNIKSAIILGGISGIIVLLGEELLIKISRKLNSLQAIFLMRNYLNK